MIGTEIKMVRGREEKGNRRRKKKGSEQGEKKKATEPIKGEKEKKRILQPTIANRARLPFTHNIITRYYVAFGEDFLLVHLMVSL